MSDPNRQPPRLLPSSSGTTSSAPLTRSNSSHSHEAAMYNLQNYLAQAGQNAGPGHDPLANINAHRPIRSPAQQQVIDGFQRDLFENLKRGTISSESGRGENAGAPDGRIPKHRRVKVEGQNGCTKGAAEAALATESGSTSADTQDAIPKASSRMESDDHDSTSGADADATDSDSESSAEFYSCPSSPISSPAIDNSPANIAQCSVADRR